MKNQNEQSRKWQMTINNPADYGVTHESINECLRCLKSVSYYCMSDEIGQTYHTHVYILFKSPVRFSTIKNLFPAAHIEKARGTTIQNKEYIFKEGEKWSNDEKKEINLPDTHEEYGEIPIEAQGARSDLTRLYEMIYEGKSNYEILNEYPEYIPQIDRMDKVRLTIQSEIFRDTFRNLEVAYLYGATGSGKTRSVMEKYGYSNLCRVTNYKNPFDLYKGEDVIVFEEFYSSLPINEMLSYLDGYPIELPRRYVDCSACYTKVYILSNIPLEMQYLEERSKKGLEMWNAFLRRIHMVQIFKMDGVETYSLSEYGAKFKLF